MASKNEDFLGNDNLNILKQHFQDTEQRAKEHEALRQSTEYQDQLSFLRKTVMDLIRSIRLCEFAATRDSGFANYMLPTYLDEIIEAAITAQLAIENGALNPARRELRYVLEVVVNIAYVDEVRSSDSFDDRTKYYRGKNVNKTNVKHVFDLPLRLLGAHKDSFANHVNRAWVKASNHVHLTKRKVDEKLAMREAGVNLGLETIDMLKQIVSDVHEACSIVMVLTFETIGPSFTGDVIVGELDQLDDWSLYASEYVAIVDAYFDYKHERKDSLTQIIQRRQERIRFPLPHADA